MPTNLTHHFLIAMPGMEDGAFSRSVVYLCEHSERGALGLIINKPGDISLADLFARPDPPLERPELRGQPVLMMSFVVDIIAMLFGLPRALFPPIAHESFGGPAEGGLACAILCAAIPAGAMIGGIFSGWVSRIERQGLAVIVAIIVWGMAMVGFGVAVGLAHGPSTGLLALATGRRR